MDDPRLSRLLQPDQKAPDENRMGCKTPHPPAVKAGCVGFVVVNQIDDPEKGHRLGVSGGVRYGGNSCSLAVSILAVLCFRCLRICLITFGSLILAVKY